MIAFMPFCLLIALFAFAVLFLYSPQEMSQPEFVKITRAVFAFIGVQNLVIIYILFP